MADSPARHPAPPSVTVADVMQPSVTTVEQNDHPAAGRLPDEAREVVSGVSSPGASDDATGSGPAVHPAAVSAPRPRDRRDRWLHLVPERVVTPPPAGQPGHGSEAVLRSQPVRIVDGRIEGGYTDVYELICPSCGDHPDLDYSEISPRLQWLRGPYRLEAALAVFHKHQGIPWPTPEWKLQGPG